eukprot:6486776-Amphidinium_carterae.1
MPAPGTLPPAPIPQSGTLPLGSASAVLPSPPPHLDSASDCSSISLAPPRKAMRTCTPSTHKAAEAAAGRQMRWSKDAQLIED